MNLLSVTIFFMISFGEYDTLWRLNSSEYLDDAVIVYFWSIEHISNDEHHFWIKMINIFYEFLGGSCSPDISIVHIRYENNVFSVPLVLTIYIECEVRDGWSECCYDSPEIGSCHQYGRQNHCPDGKWIFIPSTDDPDGDHNQSSNHESTKPPCTNTIAPYKNDRFYHISPDKSCDKNSCCH